jgi:glutathione S-transferase
LIDFLRRLSLPLVPWRPALRAYVDRCLARPALQRAKAIAVAKI